MKSGTPRTLFAFIIMLTTSFSVKSHTFLSTDAALEKYAALLENQSFFIFPEFREKPIQWCDSIPEGKITVGLNPKIFTMSAQPAEFYVYQLGVWALRKNVRNARIEFSDLEGENGQSVAAAKTTCFNKGGVDFKGNTFSKEINIPAGRIQPLWIGIDLEGVERGNYTGHVSVIANDEKLTIPLRLIVAGETVLNHGYNEGRRLSRLNWLNSTAGINEDITKGDIPAALQGNEISILGRKFCIANNGLPSSIISYFSASNQSLLEKGEPIVNKPLCFIIEKVDGNIIQLSPDKMVFTEQSQKKIAWRVTNTSNECILECIGELEYDGFVDYRLRLTAKVPLKIKDIRLEISAEKDKAKYMMGLGHEGGLRTSDWKWKWDLSKNQDMLWVGGVNGGLRIKWKAENYIRPLVNIYYEFSPLNLPASWGNDGKGGVTVRQDNEDVVINAYSGAREMAPGDTLNYNFEMLITPFKVMDNKKKFGDKYFHGGGAQTSTKIKQAKKSGANIVNIHHNEDIYPFINYPYLDAYFGPLSWLVAEAHRENIRMKFYYTTREITKNIPEFWAMYSLNGEVIFPGPGNSSRTLIHSQGPNEWLIKNLRENYIPAWQTRIRQGDFKGELDLSVITTPDSRLNNFYVAGLRWMVKNMKIDGVYIDDSALDRFTLQRARKIIDQYRPDGRIDLHSWNHFNKWAGYANCLNLYMDLLPYIDLVWIGEGRDYDRMPDHWLIEVSGIPFGISGQMLQGGGNPWRGMVYGITNRAGWTHKFPPESLWKFFDEYRFTEREIIGYWDNACPVDCDNPNIKATVYLGEKEMIIAVANWSEHDEETSIILDRTKLEMNADEFVVSIPELKDFQEEQKDVSLDKIIIPAKKGFLIIIK